MSLVECKTQRAIAAETGLSRDQVRTTLEDLRREDGDQIQEAREHGESLAADLMSMLLRGALVEGAVTQGNEKQWARRESMAKAVLGRIGLPEVREQVYDEGAARERILASVEQGAAVHPGAESGAEDEQE